MSIKRRLTALENSPLQLATSQLETALKRLKQLIEACMQSWAHLADKETCDLHLGFIEGYEPLLDNAEYRLLQADWQALQKMITDSFYSLNKADRETYLDSLDRWIK